MQEHLLLPPLNLFGVPPQIMEAETESSPRDLELSALEAEKEPMAAKAEDEDEKEEERGGRAPPGPDPVPLPGSEKNGLVKIPTDEELGGGPDVSGGCKFTGLGKEELLRAAGAPPWAKARALLLFLFWLGWLGMLGAAAAIVARAPRCRPLPPRAWWELGGLYRAPPRPFAGDLKGEGGVHWVTPGGGGEGVPEGHRCLGW